MLCTCLNTGGTAPIDRLVMAGYDFGETNFEEIWSDEKEISCTYVLSMAPQRYHQLGCLQLPLLKKINYIIR